MNTINPGHTTEQSPRHSNQEIKPQSTPKTGIQENPERSKFAVNDCTANYQIQPSPDPTGENHKTDSGLSAVQQQFVLKFCRQLVSVIEACEQCESAEIEVGRRQINKHQIKIKLLAEREFTHPTTDIGK